MTLLLDLAARACLIVVVGLVASTALRRRSAALRHAVLAISILAAGAVAPLNGWLPSWDVRMPALPELVGASSVQPATTTQAVTSQAASSPSVAPHRSNAPARVGDSAWSLTRIAVTVWGAGFGLYLAWLATGLVRLAGLDRRARRVTDGPLVTATREIADALGVRRAIVLRQTDTDDVLATWGVRQPAILLPRHADDWTADRRRVVLTHEIAHIRRCDWLVQLLADVVGAAFWFNPLFWIASARLRRDSEQACDDCVLSAGVSADRYATHLLALARRGRRPAHQLASAVPMARSSTLERRVAAMLNPALNRATLSTRGLVLATALIAVVSIPIAALRAAQTAPLPVTGVVYDPTGAVLPGAAISVEREQQAKLTASTSGGDGKFTLDAVAPGKYVLVAEVPGFRPLRQEMELRHAKDWQRIITLQVGTLMETVNIRAARPNPTRPSAGSNVGPTPVRVGGNIKAPMKTRDVRATYPPAMQEQGLEAVVPLEAIISREGTVQSLRVLSAQVHPDFVKAAMEAVGQWQYTPTLLNGVPVEVVINVKLTFALADQ